MQPDETGLDGDGFPTVGGEGEGRVEGNAEGDDEGGDNGRDEEEKPGGDGGVGLVRVGDGRVGG